LETRHFAADQPFGEKFGNETAVEMNDSSYDWYDFGAASSCPGSWERTVDGASDAFVAADFVGVVDGIE